ncbi:putative aldouronate transport system permease protein [Anaerosolibacter carboniphilus]|uniref:Putative aldouronate transport system permease protein n=1 Tax=Anaerosolibacter carboniphilus TaxID=1417629 RepID=A0A841KW44_9FIRM|nr:carbohydrate ABC transporter permease [Anaerosolibacter carboniphilus]MBB6217593.1 putative aldouronate transport system permease protein [Anaerosolibacter carboniphilus]
MKRYKKFTFGQIMLMLIFGAVTLTMIVPLLNILARSLSSPEASAAMGGLDIFPKDFSLINYRIVFSHPALMSALGNSIFVTVVGTAINIILTTTAAYVLTRPKLMFKKVIMVFLIIMMLFEPGLVPEYLVVQKLGLMGSKWSVILITAVNVYYLIIMMRYFEEIPASIFEAAEIDGAGHMRILFSIVFPLAKAGIATITMFYAVLRWNEFFKASIYLVKAKDTLFQVVLRQFVVLGDTASIVGQQNLFNYNDLARIDYAALKGATIIVAIIPILLLYPIVLRYYAKDVMGGGVKE